MKNVTIALDDEVHRKARIRAAELGTSLSALVKDYLIGLVAEGPPSAGAREISPRWRPCPASMAAAIRSTNSCSPRRRRKVPS